MIQNKLFSKLLLVAAMLGVGSMSAWAEDFTIQNASCDFESSQTLFTPSGRLTGANVVDPNSSENHLYSFVSASNAGNVAPGAFAYYDFSDLSKTAAKVDISFDCYIPQAAGQVKVSFGDASIRKSTIFTAKGSYSYNNNGAIFAIGSERGKLNGSTTESYASVSGTNYGSTTTLKANALLGLWVSVSATVDVTNKKVSYTVSNKATSEELINVTDASFYSDAADACTQLDIQTGVNSQTVYVDNVAVTAYIDASEKYANYTIKYMYGETEIKSARTVESIKVGNSADITDSDKENIWYNTEKYIYESDNAEGKTVAEDGSTVVTVTFRKATTSAYSVNLINSSDESVLVENYATGTIVEGESSTEYYHKAICIGGKWYVRAQNSEEPYYGINVVAGANTVAYTANDDVSYFFEVEDLPVVQGGSYDGWRNDGLAVRSSGGVAPRHYAKNYAYTDALAGGVYSLSMNARNSSSTYKANTILAIMDADGNITDLATQFDDWNTAQTAEKTISVCIPDGAKFVLRCGDSNSNLNMDFLLFTRTGDYTVSKSISAVGWATYCSPYALDLAHATGGLTDAFIVEGGSGGVLTKTSVMGGTVPANTGLLLKGKEGLGIEITIPVVASSSTDVSANKFVGVTANTDIAAEAGYVLMNDATNGLAFYQNTKTFTVGANTAYLPANFAGSGARAFFLLFDDDMQTTAIEKVEAAKAINGTVYNLNGQRVANPTKGLYIVNGKKFAIK